MTAAKRIRKSSKARPAPRKRAVSARTRVERVTDRQIRTLRRKIEKQAATRWNPDAGDVQRSVIQLVLTLVELIRKLMERQAIRRMEQGTLSAGETEAVGTALMEIERTIREIGKTFDLTPEDLNLDLGAIKVL